VTKILLTGAAGQLGQILAQKLASKYNVIATDMADYDIPGALVKVHKMDITKSDEIEEMFSKYTPEIVINTAAMTNVDGCEVNPEMAFEVNAKAVDNLVSACEDHVLFVQISTDYVFDGNAGPYSEDDSPNPNSIYGKSKLSGEKLLEKKHPNSLILRPNVLYNSSPDSTASFFAWVYRSLKHNQQIKVVTDQVSNPTYAPFFAEAIDFALSEGFTGLYHYGSRNYLSRYEFALQISEVFSLPASLINPIQTAELRQAAPRPAHSGLKTDKMQAAGVKISSTGDCLENILADWSTP